MAIEEKLDQIISILLKIEENTRTSNKVYGIITPDDDKKTINSVEPVKPKRVYRTKKRIFEEEARALAERLSNNYYRAELRRLRKNK